MARSGARPGSARRATARRRATPISPLSSHLSTHVATTPAGVNDDRLTTPIHTALQGKGLLPTQHLVDTG
jgi:hypothetical protein